jgi:hypothetical protein
MSTTKLIICTLVGTVYLFLLDYVWFAIMDNASGADAMPAFHWMIIGYILLALVFCLIYAKGVEPGSATQQGLKFGLLAGILVFVSANFMWLGLADLFPCMEYDLMSTIKNSVFYLVEMGVLGIIVAHLSGLSGAPEASRGGTGGTEDRSGPKPPPTTSGGGN